LLLQSKVDVNASSSRAITPLHVAAKEGHFRLLQLLIFANAVVNAQSANGITPLVRTRFLFASYRTI
jgi:ankyrin repeat protein